MKRQFIFTLVLFIAIISNIHKGFGQNTGPITPEAMSFEPVDATDMVNILTGDLSYVLPLIEVPSPYGGYPISISYHSGVGYELEASWVGLGWNVNPGVINRTINGYPDDFKNTQVTNVIRNLDGGTIINNYLSVGVGLNISGIKSEASVSFSWGSNKSLSVSFGVSIAGMYMDTNGQSSIGIPMDLITNTKVPLSINVDNKGNVSSSISMNYKSLGFSLSTKGSLGLSYNKYGSAFSIMNTSITFKDVSSNTTGYDIPIITPFGSITFSHRKIQWWIDSHRDLIINGPLYINESSDRLNENDTRITKYGKLFDLQDVDWSFYFEKAQDHHTSRLTYPALDNYSVLAQGLSGEIAPKINEAKYIYSMNKRGNENDRTFYFSNDLNDPNKKVDFYFVNENNSYMNTKEISFNSEMDGIEINPFSDELFNGGNFEKNELFYNSVSNRGATGKYIDWFSNYEIVNSRDYCNLRGFIETENLEGKRNSTHFELDGIGGFVVTSEDGKRYNFSIPVYQFETLSFDKTTNEKKSIESRMLNKYATHWLLTSIVGPDYVDRGGLNGAPNGIIDECDWGYWVKFEYGKWSDGYIWKTKDKYYLEEYTDKSKYSYSWGRKQLYYLNSVVTPTHTAYFLKSLRDDQKGSSLITNYLYDEHIPNWQFINNYNDLSPSLTSAGPYNYNLKHKVTVNIPKSQKLLKLDKIIIVKNKDANIDFVNTTEFAANEISGSIIIQKIYENITDNQGRNLGNSSEIYEKNDFYINFQNNIFDIKDNGISDLINHAIKVVEFDYSYELCKTEDEIGKLSLKAISLNGSKNSKCLPPYIFNYYNYNQWEFKYFDKWGFHIIPHNMSLKEIKTPIGGNLNIVYESDTYSKEAFAFPFKRYKIPALYSGNYIQLSPTSLQYNEIMSCLHRLRIHLEGLKFPESFKHTDKFKTYDFGGKIITDMPVSDKIYIQSPLPSIESIESCFVDIPIEQPTDIFYGGGLRVKELIAINDLTSYKTQYDYSSLSGYKTSGITSYSPFFDYKTGKTDLKYVPYIEFLPTPNVIYEHVAVVNSDMNNNQINKTVYTFDVYPHSVSYNIEDYKTVNLQPCIFAKFDYNLSPGLIDYYEGDLHYKGKPEFLTALIQNTNVNIGRLKKVSKINEIGHELSNTNYQYYDKSELNTRSQQQTFRSAMTSGFWDNKYLFWGSWELKSLSIIEYPNVIKEVNSISNNERSTQVYKNFDPYTGSPLTSEIILSNGDRIRKNTIPAYNIYDGNESNPSGMTSKIWNHQNKNMLTQEAASYTEKYINDSWKIIGSAVQTWSNVWFYPDFNDGFIETPHTGIWRKLKSFVWKGEIDQDGAYINYGHFDFAKSDNENAANNWIKTNTVCQYNSFSSPVESFDVNNIRSSAHYGIGSNNITSVTSNAGYYEATHGTFEETPVAGTTKLGFDGSFEALKGTNSPQQIMSVKGGIEAHTGNYYLKLMGNPLIYNMPCYIHYRVGRKYIVSGWYYKPTLSNGSLTIKQLNGSTEISRTTNAVSSLKQVQMGDWVLVSTIFTINSSATKVIIEFIGTNVIIDDIRVQPMDSQMSAYTYNESGNVSAILDNNNFAAKYEYDAAGRLIATYKETPTGFKKLSGNKYNYNRSLYYYDFSISPTQPKEGENVTLTATDIPGTKYQWVWGSGSHPSTPSIGLSTYTTTFNYETNNVQLNVVDPDGKTFTVNKPVIVNYFHLDYPDEGDNYQINGYISPEISTNYPSYFYHTYNADGYKIAEGNVLLELYIPNQDNYFELNTYDGLYWKIPAYLYGRAITPGSGYKLRATYIPSGLSSESEVFNITN